jgi:hypothetical protein
VYHFVIINISYIINESINSNKIIYFLFEWPFYFPRLQNKMLLAGQLKWHTKKHAMMVCTYTPPNACYGGMGLHTTKCTIRWHGTSARPLELGVMVTCRAMPPLHLEQWHEVGGMAIPL